MSMGRLLGLNCQLREVELLKKRGEAEGEQERDRETERERERGGCARPETEKE